MDPSNRPAAAGESDELPPLLEERLIDALELTGAARDAAFAELLDAHPEHAVALRARRTEAEQAGRSSAGTLGDAVRDAFARGMVDATVGPYRLRQCIGRGAHGDVYLAEQSEPLRRRVALKVLRRDATSPELWARFCAERQALALFDHPGIARILDAGEASDGRPWFAMELVPSARSLSAFVREERLDRRTRLRIFLDLCDAVQHAHARGILHRDLKPGNVLCTRRGTAIQPVVIDFGIAKATGGHLTPDPALTSVGRPLGTPLYASPEQARGALDVDIRSDVHALGAILHELLCDEPLFAEHDLARVFENDLARYFAIVTELEPELPSRRLARQGRTLAARAVRGDLDAIVARATARERDRRYETVADLRDDVAHHLAGDVVEARTGRFGYRLGCALRRYRTALGAGTVAVLALVAGLGLALERNSELRATRAALAEDRARLERTVGELRRTAAEREIARGDAERAAQSERERAAELAASNERLQTQVRRWNEAQRVLRHVAASLGDEGGVTLARFTERVAELADRSDSVYLPGVDVALHEFAGWLLAGLGRGEGALAQFEAALGRLDPALPDEQLRAAQLLHAIADDVHGAIDDRAAIEALREAWDIYDEQLGPDAPETLMVKGDLGFLRFQAGDRLGMLQAAEATAAVLFPGDPHTGDADGDGSIGRQRVDALRQELEALMDAGRTTAVEQRLEQVLAPVEAHSAYRTRLCNVLTAAARYPLLQRLRVPLLHVAVRIGERANGRGHDHVMEARDLLLQSLLFQVLSMPSGEPASPEFLAELLATAYAQATLAAIVPGGQRFAGATEIVLRNARTRLAAQSQSDPALVSAVRRLLEASPTLTSGERMALLATLPAPQDR
ncbi:MAG: protein kinase [Planctomycetes bacterium]|nr:protein kinase [Planctomycetota bacterium]